MGPTCKRAAKELQMNGQAVRQTAVSITRQRLKNLLKMGVAVAMLDDLVAIGLIKGHYFQPGFGGFQNKFVELALYGRFLQPS